MSAASDRFRLDGRVAIVTGASSGLGAATARALAEAGAKVALLARRKDRLVALAEEIDGLAVEVDLLQSERIAAVVADVASALGSPEILVNAAGAIVESVPAERETEANIRATLDLNLLAPFLLSQAVQPHMIDAGRGAIVNVSSISSKVGIPSIPQAAYAASKAGLSGLTTELAVQWARHRIRVNTVAPGFFQSEITDSLYDTDKGQAWLRRNTPLPDNGSADDIVGSILWLTSDAGAYVTGQTIYVDGGWTAR